MVSTSRLVSLIGPGGVGKSRLALRAATRLQHAFRHGVWLVELASMTDPALLPLAAAGVLRVPARPDRDPVEALRGYLSDRELLIVLDNCEQVRDACVALIAATLPHAPGLRVMATSREVLDVPGEAVYRLAPLDVPGRDGLAEAAEVSPAVALFVDRAERAMHGFKLTEENVDAVVELCRRLDGLPLAIELAAARARFLSPAQILERIDDRFHLLAIRSSAAPARHRSLKAAIEWSYDLCSKSERLTWNQLSVFPSTFDLPAAAAVCAGDGLTATEVATTLETLVDRSVVLSEPNATGMRYRMLESIREYGLQAIREFEHAEHAASEEVLRSRHLDWYVDLANEFDRDWFGPRQQRWLERLHAELPNIRSALSFAADHPVHTEAGLRLAGALFFLWRVTAIREGHSWLTRFLHNDGKASVDRARALLALAWLQVAQGHPEGAPTTAQALMMAEELDPERVPRALLLTGTLIAGEDPERASSLLRDAVMRARASRSAADTAFALFGLGWSLGLAGYEDEAERHLRASLALCEETGDLWWRGAVQLRRAMVAWLQGNAGIMSATTADALRTSRVVPDLLTCANALGVTGVAEVDREVRLAAYLFGAAERFWEDAGGSVFSTQPWDHLLEAAKIRCQTALGTAAYEEEHRRGRASVIYDAIAAALRDQPRPSTDHKDEGNLGLTQRELEVAELVSMGLTNKQIAARLVISTRTAETHVQNILSKTGFTTRTQLAAWQIARSQKAK
jgi:predicted ATPase/DNA-binding CsgD family transcriptional regulator